MPPRHRPVDGARTLLVLPRDGPQAAAPADAASAALAAEEYLRLARATRDLRYFGRAEAAIAPWKDRARVPVRIDLLAADLDQRRHEFGLARRRLDRILAADPRHLEARLKRANIGLLTGNFIAARRDCLGAMQAGGAVPGTICLAAAMTGPGSLDRARRLLAALPLPDDGAEQLARWKLLTAADLALRAGDSSVAIGLLERAHARDPADEEARARLAEALLGLGDAAQALAIADAPAPSLARQVTKLRAASALGDARLTEIRSELEASFALARRRGETHDREEALLALYVSGDARRSLQLAQRNFGRQKDTADLRVLVESARAAGDAPALRAARRWLETTRFQDQVVEVKLREAGA